jgi:hypothetical protein
MGSSLWVCGARPKLYIQNRTAAENSSLRQAGILARSGLADSAFAWNQMALPSPRRDIGRAYRPAAFRRLAQRFSEDPLGLKMPFDGPASKGACYRANLV